ncbi:ATP-binding protein [Spirosoma pollinicola]|uniref:ATP-binding protein n=1 Tax=Spirosoma pollinicola TaxID=2057025 RepID=A0A2K8YXT1_9BACT|nr:ATP-binding protein [Spirosoma pollinicola]AUD02431.1 ATP-binding protein [Spirosoma pollinicola]
METLRDIGYTIETAVADIIDNSISAGAHDIYVDFIWQGASSYISIRDSGHGMSEAELVTALRPGSRNPNEPRDPSDLGRFGLGLKTASFSQCRKVTVFSKPEGSSVCYWAWDLDYVADTGFWNLVKPEPAYGLPVLLNQQKSGTIVLWELLDRVVTNAPANDEKAHAQFLSIADTVKQHLAMVFHRFLERGRFKLYFNENPIKPWDPFLKGADGAQPCGEEFYQNGAVSVKGYVLPYHKRLTTDKFAEAGGSRGWNDLQGFYIYRNERLLVAGSWLGMFKKEEHVKLARIQVDIPNTLDTDWHIDVKKSMAHPPYGSAGPLKTFAKAVRDKAIAVYRNVGRINNPGIPIAHQELWLERKRHDKRHYEINRHHPLVTAFIAKYPDAGSALNNLLKFVEETIPIRSIMIRETESPEEQAQPFEQVSHEPIKQAASAMFQAQCAKGKTPDEARNLIFSIHPFSLFPEYVQSLTC